MSAEQQPAPEAPKPERKTSDDRAKMSELERIRHSCAHVMATAILRLWPDAQFAYGPPVENGFYYDLECSHRISPEDFEKIEAEMKKEIKANNPFEKLTVTREQAIADAHSWSPRRFVRTRGQCHQSSSWICSSRFPKANRFPTTRTAISLTSAPGRT
jgi:threonyl-tRNA synthetase